MNKLKEKDGRYYQECEVVMLAIDKKAPFYLDKVIGLSKAPQDRIIEGLEYQHLYFLSNEEIKVGDWFMNHQYMIEEGKKEYAIWKCGDITPNSNPKKIIATTDLSLGLPQPSKAFIQACIKAYNKNKPITKVLVEYEEVQTACFHNIPTQDINQLEDCWKLIPKVNSSNKITIKKVKDSYTRVVLRPIFLKLCHDTADYIEKGYDEKTEFNIDKWIEENL